MPLSLSSTLRRLYQHIALAQERGRIFKSLSAEQSFAILNPSQVCTSEMPRDMKSCNLRLRLDGSYLDAERYIVQLRQLSL